MSLLKSLAATLKTSLRAPASYFFGPSLTETSIAAFVSKLDALVPLPKLSSSIEAGNFNPSLYDRGRVALFIKIGNAVFSSMSSYQNMGGFKGSAAKWIQEQLGKRGEKCFFQVCIFPNQPTQQTLASAKAWIVGSFQGSTPILYYSEESSPQKNDVLATFKQLPPDCSSFMPTQILTNEDVCTLFEQLQEYLVRTNQAEVAKKVIQGLGQGGKKEL